MKRVLLTMAVALMVVLVSCKQNQQLKEMVYNNLIVENRWTYITDGLWETVKISVFAILLGSLVGAGVCWMRMSRRKWLAKTAAAYIDIMRGIPMLIVKNENK